MFYLAQIQYCETERLHYEVLGEQNEIEYYGQYISRLRTMLEALR